MAPVAAELQDGHVPLLNIGVRLRFVILQMKGSNWRGDVHMDSLKVERQSKLRPHNYCDVEKNLKRSRTSRPRGADYRHRTGDRLRLPDIHRHT